MGQRDKSMKTRSVIVVSSGCDGRGGREEREVERRRERRVRVGAAERRGGG